MRIGEDLVAQFVFALQRAPHLSMRNEKALIAGQSIQYRSLFSVQRQLIGGMCHFETAEVPDVLAHRQFSIHTNFR